MKIENEKLRMNSMSEKIKSLMSVTSYKLGSYKIDVENRLLMRKGTQVKLTQKEAYLLIYLAAHPNVLLKRKDILNDIWKDDSYSKARSMDVYICKIKKLISEDPKLIIINISGVGYRLIIRA